jgi:hypothetical protein
VPSPREAAEAQKLTRGAQYLYREVLAALADPAAVI